jgi:BirA family biotin operon repressor/biotin-[acetyl-CoA-carboxylase] ligase
MHRPLTQDDLLSRGPLRRLGHDIFLFTKVESTNAYLLARAAELEDGALAAAEFQTAGRGRQGRRWVAPRGSSVLVSVLLLERDRSPRIAHAGMIGAVALAEAVEAETPCRPELRWPNDLVVRGKKLGGVLAESTPLPPEPGRGAPRRAVVIGVGLNCLQQSGHFRADLLGTATSLEIECPQPIDRRILAGRLLERLDAWASGDPHDPETWQRLREAWLMRSHDPGKIVTLLENGRRCTGTVLEITDNGDLLVQLDTGARRRFESATTTRIT